jgi:hypothetical protein
LFDILSREEKRGGALMTGAGAEIEGREPLVDELNDAATEPPRECLGGRIVDCPVLIGGTPVFGV